MYKAFANHQSTLYELQRSLLFKYHSDDWTSGGEREGSIMTVSFVAVQICHIDKYLPISAYVSGFWLMFIVSWIVPGLGFQCIVIDVYYPGLSLRCFA